MKSAVTKRGDSPAHDYSRLRAWIRQADPEVVEEWKWDVVWSHDGILCTGETYRETVKLTFARGAALEDPLRPFQLQPHRQHRGARSTFTSGSAAVALKVSRAAG